MWVLHIRLFSCISISNYIHYILTMYNVCGKIHIGRIYRFDHRNWMCEMENRQYLKSVQYLREKVMRITYFSRIDHVFHKIQWKNNSRLAPNQMRHLRIRHTLQTLLLLITFHFHRFCRNNHFHHSKAETHNSRARTHPNIKYCAEN